MTKYQSNIFEKVKKPSSNTLFAGTIFQQDLVHRNKEKKTQRWSGINLPGFIVSQDWPRGSLDLDPLDNQLWSILENKARSKLHQNIISNH